MYYSRRWLKLTKRRQKSQIETNAVNNILFSEQCVFNDKGRTSLNKPEINKSYSTHLNVSSLVECCPSLIQSTTWCFRRSYQTYTARMIEAKITASSKVVSGNFDENPVGLKIIAIGNGNRIKSLSRVRNFSTLRSAEASTGNNCSNYKGICIGIGSILLGSALYFSFNCAYVNYFNRIPLQMIDEDSFDSRDDMIVVLLGSKDPKQYPKEQIERLQMIIPRHLNLYYTIKEGPNKPELKLMFYKGMRKKFLGSVDLLKDDQLTNLEKEIKSFFIPVSQTIPNTHNKNIPEYVTLNNFKERVIEDASRSSPVVLQMYEDNCFLCFLIRPFINSIHKHLNDIGHPLRIKRLNIEENDFPSGCPVTRATPTFVYYDGGDKGTKWDEFKPQDFVKKLVEVAKLETSSESYLKRLSENISQRFMLFGQLAHWLAETQHIQELLLGNEDTTTTDEVYSRAINILMGIDMTREDCLEDNLKNLKTEINSAEQDCIAIAEILAQEIIKRRF